MADKPITVPIALSCSREATITLPWFVQRTEYQPAHAAFKPLVNGEEAFGAVYDAIAGAQRSIDIICWGFQPSMYFKRGEARGMPIGELLVQKGAEGRTVRLLCWQDDLHLAELGENMAPGNNAATTWKRWVPDWLAGLPPVSDVLQKDYQADWQVEFDREWYRRAVLNNVTWHDPDLSSRTLDGDILRGAQLARGDAFANVQFATRDFSLENREEIYYRMKLNNAAAQRGAGAVPVSPTAMAVFPTHHQKMVLVDMEDPEHAVGFVMGHNMLDTYWDTDKHSCVRMHPAMGRNGPHPRQDISSRVCGPILEDLNTNFCTAWDRVTRQNLTAARKDTVKRLTLPSNDDVPVMAQILRTQSQEGKRDIETMYLQAVNNATNFIYIENQYFRWPLLADKITSMVKNYKCRGRTDPLYLFVVTNDNEEGIGPGTVNTYRMLDALGQANTIPNVAKGERSSALQQQRDKLQQELLWQQGVSTSSPMGVALDLSGPQQGNQAQTSRQAYVQSLQQQIDTLNQQIKDNDNQTVSSRSIDGLKVHVCSLVSPDTPAGTPWDYVYVHAKLMIVDDVFMTLGSANLNTRSMEVDSELNICHEHIAVTQPLREKLWGIHTNGMGVGELGKGMRLNAKDVFKQWEKIISENGRRQAELYKEQPYASLVEFNYGDTKRSKTD
ncbi:phospholipase D-like domain-containing protein [Dyella caseinilytica]|uniref:Phosphatidylserine/phosphatidylglycerophosphate/ cardiolipin synthase family protein n=1 Tax=Dyella caseinilytica TaxID=1849581 RepID=A0ABX7GUR7_9GAMM|nr:phospholipase D-like domain-containing protein [Dyella caseinilytica]QRN54044.1 phosphatidylserine/phosphatidylglycerophosphate/cardiolipin synthase family protein [Dyella caseinilytica]GFZ91178.1 phospholipase [Dyella caseinilytica]